MLYLPRSLASLVGCTAKGNTRYAISGVRVLALADQRFRAEATNGRVLAIVRGDSEDQQFIPDELASTAFEGVIPADAWKEGFKELDKHRKKSRSDSQRLGLALGEKDYAFCLPGDHRCPGPLVEGRWPDSDNVLSKNLPLASICVDPDLLIQLLACASKVCCDDEHRRVTLHFYGRNVPLGVTSKGANGLIFDGVIMPLAEVKPGK